MNATRLLLVLSLGLCCVISSSFAVPSTRSLSSRVEDDLSSSAADSILAHQSVARDMRDDVVVVGRGDQVDEAAENAGLAEELNFVEGRMDLESNDYPGAGANNHHDPRAPGTV